MQVDLINFYADDGVLLNGFISKATSKKIIISTHGMSSNCFKERDKLIAQKALENNISFMGYNNRGSELVKYIKKYNGEKETKLLGGTSYEDPTESYFDIIGAIKKAVEFGYDEIYLQGHSLGCTKIVYTYNKLKQENPEILKYVKSVILLSLVDIPKILKIFLNDKFSEMVEFAEEKEKNKKIFDIMPKESFIHPISVKTFLKYSKNNEDINFAKYSEKDFEFKQLNNIEKPLFMRWGNSNEMIEQKADELVVLLNNKIKNKIKNINYIDGADHGYTGKEEELACQILDFIKSI